MPIPQYTNRKITLPVVKTDIVASDDYCGPMCRYLLHDKMNRPLCVLASELLDFQQVTEGRGVYLQIKRLQVCKDSEK